MGFLDGIFGRSSDRKAPATDRCMECGMAEGTHTDWCPGAAAHAPAPDAPEMDASPENSPDDSDEAAPGS